MLFVSAATADICFMVPFVCLLMKTHLLALLQDNCLDLVRCAFLHKCCIGLSLAHCRKLSCLTAVRVDIDYSMQMLIISTLQGVSQDRS